MPNKETERSEHFNLSPKSDASPQLSVMSMRRTVKSYGITEEELEHIGSYNRLTSLMYSACSWFLGVGISLLVTYLMAESVTTTAKVMAMVVAPLCGIGSIISLVAACMIKRVKGTAIDRIKKDSEMIT
jgi:hypothetical protein